MTEVADVVKEILNKKHDIKKKYKWIQEAIERELIELTKEIDLYADYDVVVDEKYILVQFWGVNTSALLSSNDIEFISKAITGSKNCFIFSQSSGNINLEWPW